MADLQINLPPEADAFVNSVRKVEGTAAGSGYVKYGGQEFKPGKDFPEWEGAKVGDTTTHAAGPGQWQPGTWNAVKDRFKGYGVDLDFSNPDHQKAAIWDWGYKRYKDLTGKDLREDIKANKVEWAKLAPEWQGFSPRVTQTDKPGGKIDPQAIAYGQSRPHQSVWYLDPQELLESLPPIEKDAGNGAKRKSLAKSLGLGEDIYDLPEIEVTDKGDKRRITSFDGRNRLQAMIDAGLTAVPVVVKNLEPGVRPDAIEGMTGKVMPMRFDPVPQVMPETKPPETAVGKFLSGVRTVGEGAQQFIEHVTPSVPGFHAREQLQARSDQESAARLKALEAAGTTRSLPYMAGEVAATLPAAAIAPAAGAGIGGTMLAGAAAGAAGGLAEPVQDPSRFAAEKAQQAGIAGAIGAVTGGLGSVVGGALAPVVRPAVNKLLGEGVRMTPGQVIGGAFKRAEDVAGSVPILGAMVRRGQTRAIEDFNRAAWNRSLAPIGEKLPADMPVGRDAADYTAQRISDAYNRVVPKLKAIPDATFAREATSIAQKARNQLPDPQFSAFFRIVKGQFLDKLPASGRDLQGIDRMLGFEAAGYKVDPSRDNRVLGQLLGDLQEKFRDLLERSNPAYAAAYRDVREAFATNVRVERAAGSVGATNGVFTPAQLSNAVRATDPSARHSAFAKGKAKLQDLSDAAKDVLPQKVPDSGTPERMALMGAVGGAAHFEPHSIVGGAALSLPYTASGMNSLRWWMTHLPRTRNALASVARTGGVALAPSAGMGFQQ